MVEQLRRWWDDEIRDKTEHRRQVNRMIASGQEELWEEYYRLRKEVKQLVVEKKLNIWNEVVEKANSNLNVHPSQGLPVWPHFQQHISHS